MRNRHCIAEIVAGGLCFALSAGSIHAAEKNNATTTQKWRSWTELGGYAANREGARRGEATLWAPLIQSDTSLIFTDMRGKIFGDDQREGNFALGYRQMLSSGWNAGFWAGFDRRRSTTNNIFNQFSLGAEALSADWDFRVNGYIPFDDAKPVSSTSVTNGPGTVEIYNNALYFFPASLTRTDVNELALWGVDAEIGWRIPLDRWLEDTSALTRDLRLFAGGFHFDNDALPGSVSGPRVRAEWRIKDIIPDLEGSRLTLEAAWQHDDVRHHQAEAGLRLRIPLGVDGGELEANHTLNALEERMTEGLKRDTYIVAQSRTSQTIVSGGSSEGVEDAATEVPFNTVATVESGSNLDAAFNNAGENSLVIVKGGDAVYRYAVMEQNQTLLGGGGSILVRGRNTGTLATYTAPGIKPIITTEVEYGLAVSNNTHVSNVSLIGTNNNNGILIAATGGNVVIDNANMASMHRGVLIHSTNGTISIIDSNITDAAYGIEYQLQSTVSTIQGNTFDVSNIGITFNTDGSQNSYATIIGNEFSETTPQYLFKFENGTATIQSRSNNNVNAISTSNYCIITDGTLSGSIGFTNEHTVTSAYCTTPPS
ncbi:MAG: inverse autotransporter beta domain-containing protein, partial [Alphaproteobacteria bacterium]